MPEWYEELTGMTKDEIMAEIEKPRNQWSREVLLLVVSILMVDGGVSMFVCRREDMDVLVDGNAGKRD